MINTIYDLLVSLKEKGIKEIEPYLNIGHNPTIGDMYEGLTREILRKSIFDNMNLNVATGKIRNKEGEMSNQIDCMLVVGEGERLPYSDAAIYDADKVIAVIEVKKNLFTNELDSAYHNLKSVYNISNPEHGIGSRMMEKAFESITKQKCPRHEEIGTLSIKNQMLYHALIVESYVPARIIFGYNGFSDEYSLRRHLIDYISGKIVGNTPARGYGVTSFPNLIICGNSTLIKANGYPYILGTTNDDWIFYTSYGEKPLLILLEIIWSKIIQMFQIDITNLFDEDLNLECLHPLLKAESNGTAWIYEYVELSKDELDAGPKVVEWSPSILNEVEYIIVNRLCEGAIIKRDDSDFINFINESGMSVDEIINHLSNERLITIINGELKLLTDHCICAISPDGKYVAGENIDNRMSNWLIRCLKRK